MKFSFTYFGASCGAACLALASTLAQEAPPAPSADETPAIVHLMVAPAPEPRPALRYALLPRESERTPGNAAQHYYRAIVLQKQQSKEYWQQYNDNEQRWTENAGQDYPKQEVAQWLAGQRTVLEEIRLAAHREYCDWDFRLQDLRGPELLGFLLPEIQECRTLARIVRLKAHYEIMDGRPDDALATLRLGYQLARDAAQPPYIISSLVGVAIANIMNEELQVLMQQSQANHYWALAALPKPLVDLRPAMEFEMNMPQQMFPFLKDAETSQRSPEQWRQLIADCLKGLGTVTGGPPDSEMWQNDLAIAAMMTKLYPAAKAELIEEGYPRERIEAMPVGQVVAIQTARSVQHTYQEVFKLSLLPYADATERLPAVMRRLEERGYLNGKFAGREGLPITSLLLPAVGQVMHAEVRLSRNLAVLQGIEAIRMQAALDGRLPASLAEVTVVPVPDNPATGKPFSYTLNASSGTATLEVPPVGGLPARHDGKRIILRLQP